GFLTVLQDSIVTQANYFETASSSHFSCFDLYGIPNKVFYGLLAYKKVFEYKYQVKTVCEYKNIYVIAGCNEKGLSFFIVNYMSDIEEVTAAITLPNMIRKMNCNISVVDDDYNLEPVYETELHSGVPVTFPVKKNSILLVQSI
ncbi:MAG: hypothetical protein JXQ23_07100, partial [Clostridia bacterium]|nr:hypothetical protein [Clostridia bacterium]